MKSVTALLLLCLWAAACHAHRLARSTTQRSAATVTFGSTRSPLGTRVLHVDAFEQRHTLRLQPVAAPFADTFRLQTTAIDEEGRLFFKDVSFDDDTSAGELYEDPESGSVVRMRGTSVEGVISPTLTLTASADGRHEVVRQEILPNHHVRDFLEVPLEERRQFDDSASSRAVTNVTVEMYIVVDSTLATLLGTDAKVKNYLAVFWNAVNKRYAALTDPKIQLILAGALIIRNATAEPFITNNLAPAGGVKVNGDKALNAFSAWLFTKNASLPAYDVAYLMTGKDMFSNGTGDTSLAGIAWTGAACLISGTLVYKSGMGEDNIYYMGVMTAAHEVAHNLGSPHDGSGASASCSWNLGYIMSYITVDAKKLQFSSCSKAAMKTYISSSSASCLLKISTGVNIPLNSTLPGQIYSLDKQCQISTGQSNAYASTSVPESSLCYQLVCQWKVQNGTTIWTYTQQTGRPAAEGSPCKSGGACKDGSCQ